MEKEETDIVEASPITDGQLYEIDGGVFIAQTNPDSGGIELWTYMGRAGHVIARTGFDIDEEGNLLDRVYDMDVEDYIYPVPLRFTLADLQPVSELELTHGSGLGGRSYHLSEWIFNKKEPKNWKQIEGDPATLNAYLDSLNALETMTAHFIEMRGLTEEVTPRDIKEELQHFVGWSQDPPTTEITVQNVRALSERRLKAIEEMPEGEAGQEYGYFGKLHTVIEQAAAEERELNSFFAR